MNIFQTLFEHYNYENIGGMTDELKCIYINNLYLNKDKSLLIVCNSLYEANKFFQTLKGYNDSVLFFPMDDFMTSEVLAVSPDLKMTRLETLNSLKLKRNNIIVTNLMGYLRYLPTKKLFYDSYINLNVNDEIEIKELINKLYNIGYVKETIVNQSGQMAIRGFVIDVFPINYENPIRIEFWGNQIESIRLFDVNSQLTIEEIKKLEIIPNSEFIINKEIEDQYHHRDIINFGKVESIKDYLEDCITIYNDYNDLEISYKSLQEDILEYCISANLPSDTKFCHDFYNQINGINLTKNDLPQIKENDINLVSSPIEEKFINFEIIKNLLKDYLKKSKTIIICISNRYQANKIIENLELPTIFTNTKEIFEQKINIVIFNLNEGFIFKNYVFISEKEIFNKTNKHVSYKTNFKYGTKIKDVTKIDIGDYIVHNIHGVGRYCGIKTITKNGLNKDYLQVEYRDGDKLYVPVEKIDMISKYSAKEGLIPKINKLGTMEWEKVKLRARKKAQDIANELLKLYALREMQKGFSFNKDDENQIQFEKEFPYTETPDQMKVTEEIKKDMESNHPMDRLLCGDVGYGKTEIAFRAAFKAILSDKQVALLCPTTILSSQHYNNALERFKSFPVNIKLLNRFISSKEVNQIIEDLKEGKIDFIIGTHKLLNSSIKFKNLGLLIVDEEQRFGVTHKEKIKTLKNNIDVLTLSATPIPRTLQMSLSGLRGLSTLETPPSNRYPVQTYVVAYNKKLIKDSIYKELSRQGQVFILYNRIEGIESKVSEIQELVPEARIVYAHGRMDKNELEDIMFKFINKEYDVMICTTIIETGIDIPNVNTLIVMDADRFGLSQLYQLRGRVGRTNRLAYCYLMYDNSKILNEIAQKRLNAIKEFTELGSGLSIAMRDLSIRGAGDILGSEQAGFIDSIGIELFMEMLKQEIDKIKGIYKEEQKEETQPLIEVDTTVDDSYVKESELKIEIHKKINEIDSYEKLITIKSEIEDRFGKISDKMLIYMYEEWFESLSRKLNVKSVKQTKESVEIVLDKDITSKIDGEKLFLETLKISTNFNFGLKSDCLIITLSIKNLTKHFIYYLIDLLFVIQKAI